VCLEAPPVQYGRNDKEHQQLVTPPGGWRGKGRYAKLTAQFIDDPRTALPRYPIGAAPRGLARRQLTSIVRAGWAGAEAVRLISLHRRD
jgi:hypothetical protein